MSVFVVDDRTMKYGKEVVIGTYFHDDRFVYNRRRFDNKYFNIISFNKISIYSTLPLLIIIIIIIITMILARHDGTRDNYY